MFVGDRMVLFCPPKDLEHTIFVKTNQVCLNVLVKIQVSSAKR
jgi:hypothetical protein